jgi:hypothetical protein
MAPRARQFALVGAVGLISMLSVGVTACGRPFPSESPIQCDRIEETTCWHIAYAAMRAAKATNPGPILDLRAFPGHLTHTIGGRPDPRSFLGIVAVVVADGSLAYYTVYLNAEGRFVAVGMPKSSVT